MQPLEKSLRNKLERTVKEARDIAETAARASLEQIGVGEASPYSHLSDADKELRRKLRVHGRQLGDVRNTTSEEQEISRLIEEVAYEHWHRMLFARFLAENNLLMFDGVAVTLEECDDLAADEGAANGWELAARCAAKMLPQIFRPDSPVFQLHFAANHQLPLEKLISDLSQEVFTASDSMGWVYQFWQAKRKDEVNASEVKIGARELSAVTQLFTEPYMVAFLLDNALGSWWVAKLAGLKEGKELRPGARHILKTAEAEEDLREFFSLPGVPLEYLRFVKQDDGDWLPATGTFDGWPDSLGELKTLDPCCGSGHFLVAVFLMLVAMRMELENLSPKDAVDDVLRENIHGLELDQRCVELAAFALALTAWRYPAAGGYRLLPKLNVACSGLAVSAKKEEWLALAGDNTNFRLVLEELYKKFKDAPIFGSLINPEASLGKDTLYELKWEEIGPLLSKALSSESDNEIVEMGVVAQGLIHAASMMVSNYHWITTNVPFKKKGELTDVFQKFLENDFPIAKNALETAFLQRCLEYSFNDGHVTIVLPQNWLFLKSYDALRVELLTNYSFVFIGWLGEKAFQTPLGVAPILLHIKKRHGEAFYGCDVSKIETIESKAEALHSEQLKTLYQSKQLGNPDYRITYMEQDSGALLNTFADSSHGQGSFDSPRYSVFFWEIPCRTGEWEYQQSSSAKTLEFSGCSFLFRWEQGCGGLWEFMQAKKEQGYTSGKWRAGVNLWGKKGVLIRQIGKLPATLYRGFAFDDDTAAIVPKDQALVPAIWCYCSSDDFNNAVRRIDQKRNVTNSTLAKVPFDIDYWTKFAAEKYPDGLPRPYSDDPTQWIFYGHPAQSDETLQVAVARLIGYRWPAELDSSMELSDEARIWVKKSEELLPHADDDGIVCIPAVRGEMKAEGRIENLLATAFSTEWSSSKKSELLAQADHAGKSMETWLRDKFFVQHCKLFQHRPFIWHIWDGLHDGFAALVNYHKLDHKTLETLIYNYLGDWISRQKQDITNSVDGAEGKLTAAEQLKKKLELILEGEAPYDIFVRWKPLNKQAVGWAPDLNDGVRLNIRPFIAAGVLRFNKKPQINVAWEKDRGKDVESAPWYHLFDGDRINDHHLTLDQKRQAREKTP